MKDKETKLIEKLIDDKAFLMKFSESKSLEEQLKFLKENGFNFSEEEFKEFLKSLEEAYVSSENMSEEELENVSGGKMEMRSKIAAAALVFSALGAGSMMGQASAAWSDYLPHNLVRSAYNAVYTWLWPSSEGDGQSNAASASTSDSSSQRSRSALATSERLSQRRKLEQASSGQRSNSAQRDQSKTGEESATSAHTRQRRSNSDPDTRTSVAQPSASTKDADETLRVLNEKLERLAKEIESYKTSSPDLEKVGDLSDSEKETIQVDYVTQLSGLEAEYKETEALIKKMEQERKRESKQILERTTEESRRPVPTTRVAAAAADVQFFSSTHPINKGATQRQTDVQGQVGKATVVEQSQGKQSGQPFSANAQWQTSASNGQVEGVYNLGFPIVPNIQNSWGDASGGQYGKAAWQASATSPVFQAPVLAQSSVASGAQQGAQSQNEYVTKFRKAQSDGSLSKFVQDTEEEFKSLTVIRGSKMSPEEKKGLEERLRLIGRVRMFRPYQVAKRELERSGQPAVVSSTPSAPRVSQLTGESRRSLPTVSVAAAAAAAPAASTKDADETLSDLKEKLRRLNREIELYRTGSPDLEKNGDLPAEAKRVIQVDYVTQLSGLEAEYKETEALIKKMEQERKRESKQRLKGTAGESRRSLPTVSVVAAAAPVTVSVDQSVARGAASAAAKLLSLKSKILVLNKQKNDISGTYELLEKEGERGNAILAKNQVTEVEGLIQTAKEEIARIELNLQATGQLNLVKSMEAQHSGIQNLGGTCYLNTALQVLTQESAKDTVTGKSFKEEISEVIARLKLEQRRSCPVLNVLSEFFTAYDNESVDGANLVSRGTMQRILDVLKNIEGPDGINKRIVGQDESDQSDTTEALGKIIEECISECQGKPELAGLKDTIERLFAVVLNQDFVLARAGDKLGRTGEIKFEEYFHDGLVKRASKNIVIPFNRAGSENTGLGQFDYTEMVLTTPQSFQQALRELGEQGRRKFLESHKGATVFPAGASTNWQKLEHLYNSKSPKDKEEMVKAMIGTLLRGRDLVEIDGAKYVNHDGKVCRRTPKYTGAVKVRNPIEIREYIRVNGRDYRLKAISIHDGSSGRNGHYYAYIRSSINPDVWLCHNDGNVCRNFGYPIKLDDSADNNGGPRMGEEIANTGSLITDSYVRMNATNMVYELVE